jgi:multiple sugar transport system substrate-binding protein
MTGTADGRRARSGPTRRRFAAGAAGLVGLGGLLGAAGCGAPAGDGAPSAAGQARTPVTLRLNHRTERYFAVRTKQFSEAYPWITVDLVTDSGYEKLMALLAAGDLGDVIWTSTGVGTYFELASQGVFANLEGTASADKYDLKQHFPRAVETARSVDGKLFALPVLIHPSHLGLYYNVNLFESAQVRAPSADWTLEDVVEAARRLTGGAGPGGRPATWGILTETGYPPLVVFLRTFGGEFMDPPTLGKKTALDRAPAKQALQWLYDLRHRHRVHPVKGADQVSYTDGNVAMMTTHMSGIATAMRVADRFRTDAILLPKGPTGKRGSQGHVDMMSVNAKSRHQDAAWLLLKWFVGREAAPYVFEEHGIPGSRPDGWSDIQATAPPMYRIFKEFMEKEGPGPLAVPWNYRMLEAGQFTDKAFDPLWTGEGAPDRVVAAAVGPHQAFLDQPRPGT